ncbi:MAG TPA: hypothetical protein VMB46_04435 [Methanomassiliicoccales archaeon]|nr:hypothetical protein [Methanomassiliicoccales archaeon]
MPVSEKQSGGGACGSASFDETKKIWVAGVNVGISEWGKICQEVLALGLKDDNGLANELLKRVKTRDFVPASKEREYRKALLEEYKKEL